MQTENDMEKGILSSDWLIIMLKQSLAGIIKVLLLCQK